jgi:diacylglycerol kinase (ATP)
VSRPDPTSDPASSSSALSLRRWWRSAGFAFSGVRHVWVTQPNFRIEVSLGGLACALGLLLRVPLAPILLCCGLVLSLEVLNTAVEALTDLASPEWHDLAQVAKDTAAGAVLIASVFSVLVGAAVLLPALLKLIGGA